MLLLTLSVRATPSLRLVPLSLGLIAIIGLTLPSRHLLKSASQLHR